MVVESAREVRVHFLTLSETPVKCATIENRERRDDDDTSRRETRAASLIHEHSTTEAIPWLLAQREHRVQDSVIC